MINNKYTLKNKRKSKSSFNIRTPKIINELSLSQRRSSINDFMNNFSNGKDKTKLMITGLLGSYKSILINKKKYSSSTALQKKFHYFYPYKPNNSQKVSNLSQNEEKLKLYLSPKSNDSITNINGYFTPNNQLPSVQSSFSNNKVNFKKIFKSNGCRLFVNNRYNIDARSPMDICKDKKFIENDKNNNSFDSESNDDKLTINDIMFTNFIDEINKNIIYINKCKKELKEYFKIDEKKGSNKSFFEELLYKYRFDEHEHNNFFLTDFYSTKKNSFNIGHLNINFKLSSLEFVFYEITEDNLNEKNIDVKLLYDLENKKNIKYNINTKIKFPFEYLAVFYGINTEEFINLIVSMIEFDYENNKFSIDHSNFIAKTEIGKTLYDFYTESSYIHLNNYNNSKECLIYDWEVKTPNNEIRHFILKIILPQMKIHIKCANKTKIKFFKTISIRTMGDLIKNSFYKWDYFLLIKFSEFKLFRYEINKIISDKYSNIDNSNKENIFKNNKNMKKIIFNLNKMFIILNTLKKNSISYGFFYSNKKLSNGENETYYINLKLPKINIAYHNLTYSYNKKFDIDIKSLSQLNKLRKSFHPEDIIKYSMIIKKNKNKDEETNIDKQNIKKLLSSKKVINSIHRRKYSISNKQRSRKNSKNVSVNKKEGNTGQIKFNKNFNNEDFIKDIKLNLNKYIFNFDESILKYINLKENDKKNYDENFISKNIPIIENIIKPNIVTTNNTNVVNNSQKLDIEIGNIELFWTNNLSLTKHLILDKKESDLLLDHPQSKWKFIIEKNINKYLSDEKNVIKPIRRSSKKVYGWKDFMTEKEG